MSEVTTDRGRVRGASATAFLGIPYAAPPVGDLRFAPPRPHEGWTGTLDARRPGPSAPQPASRLAWVMGPKGPDWDEARCLTLNVWRPSEPARQRPVLVWFHGGGYTSGSGGWDWYDGARLAELGDIVVVTTNYRLGPLGYLYLPEIGADNLGLQDQAAVLRWVRDNIAAFGGDPDQVTVGGQSAGALSALQLALAPETRGLIRRVIGQSTPFGLAPLPPDTAAERTAEYLRVLGVGHGEALRDLPVQRLLSGYGELAARMARPGEIWMPMYPVTGGAGYARDWSASVADGALTGMDVLLGATADETTAFFANNGHLRTADRARVLELLGDDRLYEKFERPGATPAQVFTSVMTELTFAAGLAEIATSVPAHLYHFEHTPDPDDAGLGATHCAELPFLFGTFDAYRDGLLLGDLDRREAEALWRRFGGALAAFVATGSPGWPSGLPGQRIA